VNNRDGRSLGTLGFTCATLLLLMGRLSVCGADPQTVAMTAGAHQQFMGGERRRTNVNYAIPNVTLRREDGIAVGLPKELDDGRPVIVNFIFTSCTSICPMSSQTLALLQERLGKDRDRVHIVSVSIDPEQDSPQRLHEYAQHFNAGKSWHFYTGSLTDSVVVQRAFDVYRGEKMAHTAVTLMRSAPGKGWVRFDGYVSADELYAELEGDRQL